MDPSPMDTLGNDSDLLSTLGLGSTPGLGVSQAPLSLGQPAEAATSMNFPGVDAIAGGFSGGLDFDPSWMEETAATMDWRYLDISLAHSHDSGRNEDTGQTWMERPLLLEDLDMMGPGGWGQAPSGNNF